MGFLKRETEQERLERERAEAEEAARLERERAHEEARVAAARADYDRWVATLPKWEYRVLTQSAMAGLGAGTIGGLEDILNSHAAEGWRVVATTMSGKIEQALAADTNDMYIVLERPARGTARPPS